VERLEAVGCGVFGLQKGRGRLCNRRCFAVVGFPVGMGVVAVSMLVVEGCRMCFRVHLGDN
jgi:hypothetical protein